MEIYIIRHGVPNYKNDCLLEQGKKQALELESRLHNIHFDKIYVSSQGRAIETASPTCKSHKIEPIICDWAREDLGAQYFWTKENGDNAFGTWFFWSDVYRPLFRSKEMHSLGLDWIKHPKIKETSMPEGFKIMSKNVDKFMLENGYKHNRKICEYEKVGESPKRVAIFAHGAFAFSFISNLLDIPYPEFTTTHDVMECTAISIIEIKKDQKEAILKVYNDYSHLKTYLDFEHVLLEQ